MKFISSYTHEEILALIVAHAKSCVISSYMTNAKIRTTSAQECMAVDVVFEVEERQGDKFPVTK